MREGESCGVPSGAPGFTVESLLCENPFEFFDGGTGSYGEGGVICVANAPRDRAARGGRGQIRLLDRVSAKPGRYELNSPFTAGDPLRSRWVVRRVFK